MPARTVLADAQTISDTAALCAAGKGHAGFTLKDVQEWMEHADIKMTADIYGHLDVARKKDMANQLSGSLFH